MAAAMKNGVTAETLVVAETRQLSDSIVRDVDIHRCDAIVMATHARSGLPRIVEGSVTQAVIERSDVSVVVLRRPDS